MQNTYGDLFFLLLPSSLNDCVVHQQVFIKTFKLWFCDSPLTMAYNLEQIPRQTRKLVFSLSLFFFFFFFFLHICWYKTTTGYFCWNLILFWRTTLPNDIYYNYWYVCHLNFLQYLLPEQFLSHYFFLLRENWQTIKIMNLQHTTLIFVLIILFLFFNIFWCFIIFGLFGY